MKLVAFAASSSRQSINKQLVSYAASLVESARCEILDLNDYELPLFSVDREAELGHPRLAADFLNKLGEADALMVSFAEHNGAYSAAFKSLFDWCSRIDTKVWQNKPMLMLATSPGARGGAGVLATALNSAPHFGGDVKASLSVPSFGTNFDTEKGELTDAGLRAKLEEAVRALQA